MRLQAEKSVLGWYFSGHPLQAFEQELATLGRIPIAQLEKSKQGVICSGLLLQQRLINTRKGMRMAVVTLEDLSGRIDVTIFSKLYEQVKNNLLPDQVYLVRGNIEEDTYTGGIRMVADSIESLSNVRMRFARHVKIQLADADRAQDLLNRLPNLMQPFLGGRCEVVIGYQGQQAGAKLLLGENWKINPTNELLEKLREACSIEQLTVEY